MKRMNWLALVPAGLLLTGCAPDLMSLHPLYTNDDLLWDSALEGTWNHREDEKIETWRFERADDRYHLYITETGGGVTGPIACRLVRLSNYLFLDVSDGHVGTTGIPGHMFLRVELEPDSLSIAGVNDKWLREKLDTERALAYERVGDGSQSRFVIRASTLELQAFFKNYAADAKAFPEWVTLGRL